MVRALLSVAVSAAVLLGVSGAHAADAASAKPSPLDRYERTGQFQTCISVRQINAMKILNAHQILFEMTGGRAFLAEPKHCAGLNPTSTLSYDTTLGQLCNTTIIYLVDLSSPVPQRGACGIERFEKLTKKPEKKSPPAP